MIITCNKCSTRFNLDYSLVKANGSKVRCSVCNHIFTAYPHPLPEEPEQTVAPVADFDSEPALDDIPDFEMEDSDFSLKDTDLEIENQDLVLEDSEFTSRDLEQKDTDFSFEEDEFELNTDEKEPDSKEFEFEADDISEDIPLDAGENKDDEFDGIEFEPMKDEPDELMLNLEEETGTAKEEDEFELEFDVEEDSTESPSDTPDDAPLDIIREDEGETLTLEQDESEEDLAEITPEGDFSEYDAVLEQNTEPEETPDEEAAFEEEPDSEEPDKEDALNEKTFIEKATPLMDLPERRSRRKKKTLLSLPILMLVLIFFLTAGAYIASIMTGYKIPHLSDVNIPFLGKYLKKTDSAAMDVKPVPNENSVNGRFVSNAAAGTLFVITGRVDNTSGLSYSHIEVQGTLSTKEIPAAKTKNAFCGNIITEEMLKSGNLAEMMKLLEVKEGAHNSNVNIKTGSGVPFMIIFSELPEKLQNFNVKVVGFEKATAN